MKLIPLDDCVVVKPLDPEKKTPGGIVLPDSAQQRPTRGKVLAVGPGKWSEDGTSRVEIGVKVGDVVVYNRYAGHDIEMERGGEEIKILRSPEILAKVEE